MEDHSSSQMFPYTDSGTSNQTQQCGRSKKLICPEHPTPIEYFQSMITGTIRDGGSQFIIKFIGEGQGQECAPVVRLK